MIKFDPPDRSYRGVPIGIEWYLSDLIIRAQHNGIMIMGETMNFVHLDKANELIALLRLAFETAQKITEGKDLMS